MNISRDTDHAETAGHTLTPSEGGDMTFEGKPPAPIAETQTDEARLIAGGTEALPE